MEAVIIILKIEKRYYSINRNPAVLPCVPSLEKKRIIFLKNMASKNTEQEVKSLDQAGNGFSDGPKEG